MFHFFVVVRYLYKIKIPITGITIILLLFPRSNYFPVGNKIRITNALESASQPTPSTYKYFQMAFFVP